MIKTNELMLGNWVESNGSHRRVLMISPFFAYLSDGVGHTHFMSLNGIPITAELLEKCGFDGGDHIWKVGDTMLYQNRDDFDLSFYGQFIDGIIFFHELQNAYFMLTKKHLEVKL